MKNTATLSLLAAFAMGCVAARAFVVPPARAQGVQRWEYLCIREGLAEELATKANKAGAQGWELVGGGTAMGWANWCFKRPL